MFVTCDDVPWDESYLIIAQCSTKIADTFANITVQQ